MTTTPSLQVYLTRPAFKPTYVEAIYHISTTLAVMASVWYWATIAAVTHKPMDRLAVHACATVLWAGCMVRSFVLFHDCGHKSLFPRVQTNRRWMPLLACMAITPSDWNVGHALHHANVGNKTQEDYDWGETVYHTVDEYLALPSWKRRCLCALRHPLVFFALAPPLTWWVRMRLPMEPRVGRKAAYRTSNKLGNALFLALRYCAAHACGILAPVLLGDYFGMVIGVLLFHTQHVYDGGYVRSAKEWTLRDAAMHGSSLLHVPRALRWFTCGIEYHHIHHFKTSIPGYRLAAVHDGAPEGMFDAVPRLDTWAKVRDSLYMTLYDEERRTYVGFGDVKRRA